MSDRINKTSICSVLFLDIVDFSKKSDEDQIEVKTQFNELINLGLKDVAQNDRIILDTGDGVAVAHMGSPEEAMFVALTIRDGINQKNLTQSPPLLVRFGINLGPVRIVSDLNGRPNILGDGINVAQRIMSFAEANQILVSRSYFEVTSRLTQEFSEMFAFSGLKQDKHVRKHEVYAVRSHKTKNDEAINPPMPRDQRQLVRQMTGFKKLNWQFVMLSLPIIFAFAYLAKTASFTEQPINKFTKPNALALKSSFIKATVTFPVVDGANKNHGETEVSLMPNETVETLPLKKESTLALLDKKNLANKELEGRAVLLEKNVEISSEKTEALKVKAVKEKAKAKAKKQAKAKSDSQLETDPVQIFIKPKESDANPVLAKTQVPMQAPQHAEISAENTQPKTGWKTFTDSVKQGQERRCSQVEINMNQCH